MFYNEIAERGSIHDTEWFCRASVSNGPQKCLRSVVGSKLPWLINFNFVDIDDDWSDKAETYTAFGTVPQRAKR